MLYEYWCRPKKLRPEYEHFGPFQADVEDFKKFFSHHPRSMFFCRVYLTDAQQPPESPYPAWTWNKFTGWKEYPSEANPQQKKASEEDANPKLQF